MDFAAEVEALLIENNPETLWEVAIAISLNPPDCAWAEQICLRLANHPHFNVRGNALLGFGHLARLCGALDRAQVQPLIEAGLQDPNDYVRSQSAAAASDLAFFLGWEIAGYPESPVPEPEQPS